MYYYTDVIWAKFYANWVQICFIIKSQKINPGLPIILVGLCCEKIAFFFDWSRGPSKPRPCSYHSILQNVHSEQSQACGFRTLSCTHQHLVGNDTEVLRKVWGAEMILLPFVERGCFQSIYSTGTRSFQSAEAHCHMKMDFQDKKLLVRFFSMEK